MQKLESEVCQRLEFPTLYYPQTLSFLHNIEFIYSNMYKQKTTVLLPSVLSYYKNNPILWGYLKIKLQGHLTTHHLHSCGIGFFFQEQNPHTYLGVLNGYCIVPLLHA